MDPVFDARFWAPGQYADTVTSRDFDTEAEALAAVETAGEGQVVKFARHYNLPGALPAIRLNSIWLKVYEGGTWRSPNIHG